MEKRIERLQAVVSASLGKRVVVLKEAFGELLLEVKPADYREAALMLRDSASLGFEQLIDLSGVDYSQYRDTAWNGLRFAAVSQLLSIKNNWRIRLRTFAEDDAFPVVDSLTSVWSSAGWYEREAFDLFGIIFSGHTDLRRILTDYGFVGHPFRKDFPLSGNVEMRYDPDQKRVVYQPVTIEPRETTPRIIREVNYGALGAQK